MPEEITEEECPDCGEEIDQPYKAAWGGKGCIDCANQSFYACLAFFSLACCGAAMVLHHFGY